MATTLRPIFVNDTAGPSLLNTNLVEVCRSRAFGRRAIAWFRGHLIKAVERRSIGLRHEGIPSSLWAFAVLTLGTALAYFLFGGPGEAEVGIGWWAVLMAIYLVMLILLLRRSRIVWTLLVAFGGFALLSAPFTGQPWWAISIEAANLACLLAPPSWRFIWRRHSALVPEGLAGQEGFRENSQPPQASWDPDEQADSDRPSGWYVDPGSPDRMRHWDASAGKWSKATTKTPYKIRRALETTRQE